jgi:phage anti-repressor protein
MNLLTKPKEVDFTKLVANSNPNESLKFKSRIVDELKEHFTEEEQKIFIANFYMYLNYSSDEYPINLEDVWKYIGFANKGNAKRTLENNFTLDEDYHLVLLPMEKRQHNEGGINKETIMMKTDTFKNLCLLSKTEQGKRFRKYFIKMETVNNKMIHQDRIEYEIQIKKQLEENEQKLNEKDQECALLLKEKDKYIENLKITKITTLYIGHNYMIKDVTKIGITDEPLTRVENHKSSNPQFEYLYTLETIHAKNIENLIKLLLKPFKNTKSEWFNISFIQMKQMVDYALLAYSSYKIHDNFENLLKFISHNKSVVINNKYEKLFTKDVYNEFITENIVIGENYRVSGTLICNDFHSWMEKKYPHLICEKQLKMKNNKWLNKFVNEICNHIQEKTCIKFLFDGVNLNDVQRGIRFMNYSGFIGMELKSMQVQKITYFDAILYKNYVDAFLIKTTDPNDKISRSEILQDFVSWTTLNNYASNIKSFTPNTTIFIQEFTNSISQELDIDFDPNLNKQDKVGGFSRVFHSVIGKSIRKVHKVVTKQTENEKIKCILEKWKVNTDNTNLIRIVYQQMLIHGKLSVDQIRIILKRNQVSLSQKRGFYNKIFEKKDNGYWYLSELAKSL